MRAVTLIAFLVTLILFVDSVYGSERRQRRTSNPSSYRRPENPLIEATRLDPQRENQAERLQNLENEMRRRGIISDNPEEIGGQEHLEATSRSRRPRQGERQDRHSQPSTRNARPSSVIQDADTLQLSRLRLGAEPEHDPQANTTHNSVIHEPRARQRDPQREIRVERLQNLEIEMRRRGIISDPPEENPETPRPRRGIMSRGIAWLNRQMEYQNIDIHFYTEREGNQRRGTIRNPSALAAASMVPPARIHRMEDARNYSLGQIVTYRNHQVIIFPNIEREEIQFRPMTDAERRIFARILGRNPTNPRDYRIPPLYYSVFDRLVRPVHPPRMSVKQVGECFFSGTMTNIDNRDPVNFGSPIEPRDGDLLFRGTNRYIPELGDNMFKHIATFDDGIWVAVDLLPTSEEREAEQQLHHGRLS